MRRSKKGFTLIELVVTVGIIAILTGASILSMRKIRKSDRVVGAANTFMAVFNATQRYAIQNSLDNVIVMVTSNINEKKVIITPFIDVNRNFTFDGGDIVLTPNHQPIDIPGVVLTSPPSLNGGTVVSLPCGNIRYPANSLFNMEKTGGGICFSSNSSVAAIRFSTLGIPVDVFGAPMPCKGFLTFRSVGYTGKLGGVEITQTGFVDSCIWNPGKERWVKK